MKIINIAGARPNFMKIAPIHKLMLKSEKLNPVLLQTGQHYDSNMTKIFFDDLGMPEPEVDLKVGSGSHAVQTAIIMIRFEEALNKIKPDLIIVVGDVNSTIACSLVAAKMGVKIAHVEAGLRSFDRSMPEEINRILTDAISDYLFVSEESGLENLRMEGVAGEKIIHVGNVMIDSLINNIEASKKSTITKSLDIEKDNYLLVTLHRPVNVDFPDNAGILCDTLTEISKKIDIVFPIHPRTKKNFREFGLLNELQNNVKIKLTEPMGYLDFLNCMLNCLFIITDSGGIQEETTYLQKPCLTLRDTTERPSTIKEGTNILIKELDKELIIEHSFDIIKGNIKKGAIPEYWDGMAAERIVSFIEDNII